MSTAIGIKVSDERLLAEFCSGSAEAFGRIAERHLPLVRSVAARVLGDRHEAEDVAQAVFILLARKAPGLRKPGSLSSWLFRAAEFTARRTRRKLITRAGYEREAAVVLQDEKAATPEVPSDWPELRGKLDRAITALPGVSQRAVVLCYLEGRTREEAAGILGCSVDALAMRLSRAVRKLRDRLSSPKQRLSVSGLTAGLVFESAWSCADAATSSPAAIAESALAEARGDALGGASAEAKLIAADASQAMAAANLAKGAGALVAAGVLALSMIAAFGGSDEDKGEGHRARSAPRMIYRDPGEYSEWVGQWKMFPAGTIPAAPGIRAPIRYRSKTRRPVSLDVHPSPDGKQVLLVASGHEFLRFRYLPRSSAALAGKAELGAPADLQSGIARVGRYPVNWLAGGRLLLCGGSSHGQMLLEVFDASGKRLRSIPVPEVATEIPITGDRKLRSIAPVLVGPRGLRAAVLRADYAGKGRLVRDAAVIVPLVGESGKKVVCEFGDNANVAEAAWSADAKQLLVARIGFSGGQVAVIVESVDVMSGEARDVFRRLLTPPQELSGTRWPRGAPRVSFSPDSKRLLIVWRKFGLGARVLRASVISIAGRRLTRLPWVDGPGSDLRGAGEWVAPIARPRWRSDASALTFAVARPKPGLSARLCCYTVFDRKTRELASWRTGMGPRAGDIYSLAGGTVAFLANHHLWLQREKTGGVPVPLALVPTGAVVRPTVSGDGARIYIPSWRLSASGVLKREGVMAFAAAMPDVNRAINAAYWSIFGSGRERDGLECDLREFVSKHSGKPLAQMAGRYLKECRPAKQASAARLGRNDAVRSPQPEVF